MDVVFFGDGLWATKCLQRLLHEGHRIRAVVLRRQPSDSTLGNLAQQYDIPLHKPTRVNTPEFVDWLRSLRPDLNVSVSYDQILRQPVLSSAPMGCINCHAGKLPHYRGRNVINWAVINNESEIGLTVHYIDEGIDTGDIIVQRMLPIDWEDTYGSVLVKVQEVFPDLLIEALQRMAQKSEHRQPQQHHTGTYFSKRMPGDEWIDWHDTSLQLYNKIRAITHPGPGCKTVVNGRTLIIWRARYDRAWPKYIATPGEVVGCTPGHGVRVKTGDSTILLDCVQFEATIEAEHIPNFRIGTRFGVNMVEILLGLQNEVAELRAQVDNYKG